MTNVQRQPSPEFAHKEVSTEEKYSFVLFKTNAMREEYITQLRQKTLN
jgi:hypothetical protein